MDFGNVSFSELLWQYGLSKLLPARELQLLQEVPICTPNIVCWLYKWRLGYNCAAPFELCWRFGCFSTMNFPSWLKPKITTLLICRIATISEGKKESSCWKPLSWVVKAVRHFPFSRVGVMRPEVRFQPLPWVAGWSWGQPRVTWRASVSSSWAEIMEIIWQECQED